MMDEDFSCCDSFLSDSSTVFGSSEETSLLEADVNARSMSRKSLQRSESDLSYGDADSGPLFKIPKFSPFRKPGPYIFEERIHARRAELKRYTSPGYFFKLFFCEAVMLQITTFTNKYAKYMKSKRPYAYYDWTDVTPTELYAYFALVMYMCVVTVHEVHDYWSSETLFHGLWARAFMCQKRFELISESLRLSDYELDDENDQLSKVRIFQMLMQSKAIKFWQPFENVSITVHKIKYKRKSGMKLMILTDTSNGYTCNFTTKDNGGLRSTEKNLSSDITLSLLQSLLGQGFRLFTDDYFTSKELFVELLKHKTVACGSIPSSHIDVLSSFRNACDCNIGFGRGSMRWMRTENIGLIQWKDSKLVTLLTSMHKNLTEMEFVIRKIKVNDQHRKIQMRKPIVVKDYEKAIYSIDTSERLIDRCPAVRGSCEIWKVLFYTIMDIARGNSFILFREFAQRNQDIKELHRPSAYSQLQFTIELIKELGNVTDHTEIPMAKKLNHTLIPEYEKKRRNCVRCYRNEKVERKTSIKCKGCNRHFCFTRSRKCLVLEHSDLL